MSSILPPAAERHFEDYPVGAIFDLGSFVLSEDDMVDFATRYDPQSMHVDRDWAAQGPFGGLIASGWHTVAALMRLIVENFLPHNGLASPGVNELRWLAPLRPGDDLMLDVEIVEARVSRSRPSTGIVTVKCVIRNAAGQVLCEMISPIIVERLPARALGQAG